MQEQFNITDEVDGSAISYTITYYDATSGSVCGSDTIYTSESMCIKQKCSHIVNLSSQCNKSNSIAVTIFATSILGNGSSSNPVNISVDLSK